MAQIPDKDTVRNSDLNGTEWDYSGHQHKNVKRLAKTLPDVVRAVKSKERIAIKCSKCGHRFRTVKGVLPKHGYSSYYPLFNTDPCIGGKAVPQDKPFKARFLKEVEIKGIIYKEGDTVLVEKRASSGILPWNVIPKRSVLEATIAYFMTCENGDVTIRFTYGDEEDRLNHTSYLSEFVKNGLDIIKV
jgi:hypothetical protein